MFTSCSFGWRIEVVRQFRQVTVFAKKDNRSSVRSTRTGKGPRKKYTPDLDELGDISVLKDETVVVENSDELLKSCNEHINYFVEGRDLREAEALFDLMIKRGVEPDTITFNTLMKGYTRSGNTERISKLFLKMEEHDVKPDEITFNTAIRSHASKRDLKAAQTLLEKMKATAGVEPDRYTFNSMLNVCVAARDLDAARELLQEMKSADIRINHFTMNIMIDIFAECCTKKNAKLHLEKCKEVIEEIESKGIMKNKQAFNTLLKLCSRGELTREAMEILAEMRERHVHPDVVSYNTVLDGISKNKKLSNEGILEFMSRSIEEMRRDRVRPDSITYNALMSVALRLRDSNRADQLFNEMKMMNLTPDAFTYALMIKCHEKLGDPKDGDDYLRPCLDLLKDCEEAGLNLTFEGYISLFTACAKVSDLDQALRIWNTMISTDKRNITASTYNAMISVCISAGDLFKAIDFFYGMQAKGISPDSVTYATMIKAYQKLGDPYDGEDYLRPCLDLMEECGEAGINLSIEGYISLISACAKVSDLNQALKIWDRMKEKKVRPYVSAFNAIINVCLSIGREHRAFDFLDQMNTAGIKPNEVTFGTFISYFWKKRDAIGARIIRSKMDKYGVKPNQRVSSMLRALKVE